MIKILDNSLNRQAILKEVIEPNRFEEINGENTLTFSAILDEKTSTYINENAVVELDDDYYDIAYFKKNQNEDGTLTIDIEAEHVSYRLNNPDYDLDTFTSTGTPTAVLTALLSGTGFTVGTVSVSDSITYSAQEKKSRRMMLMELVALLGGEVDFDKFAISILAKRGSTDLKILTKGKNIKVVSKIYNKRERDAEGNPLISYTCTPIMLPDVPLALGDESLLIQKDLGIQEQLRIVRIGYNPYNPVEAEIELANFVSGLEDQLYRIETSTVAKGKVYNGCRISADEGFVANRSDNKAKTVLNATEGISIYSDLGSGLVKNFFVDTNGRIQAKGLDIDGSGTFSGTVAANQILIGGANGTISFDDLSDVPGYIKSTYIDSTTVQSPSIVGGTVTGSMIRTSASGQRLQMTSSGIISYNTNSQKEGVCVESSSGYSKVEFYKSGNLIGSIGLNGLGQYNIVGSIDFNNATVTGLDYSGYATQLWVADNFASDTHGHGNDYVKSRQGDNLSIAATSAGIVVRDGETVLGSLLFD